MGGSSPKRESNSARNTRILAEKRSGKDAAALQAQEAYLANARRRGPLFGGPETGRNSAGATNKLGVN